MAEEQRKFHWRAPPDWMWRAFVFLLALAALILITTRWNRWESNARIQTTDDAYLQSDLTPIAAKVAGYVRSIPVQDYQRVNAGQLLVQIVDDDYRATVDQLALSDAQDRAHKAFDMAHDQFLAGALSNLDLLTTEQTLVAADAAVAISDAALVQDQIVLFKALGGGWRNPETSAKR